jgi:transcriptional regulator GlxA family with amidase domain
VFDVQLAGLDNGTVSCRDGVSLHPSIAFSRERSHHDTIVHQVREHIDLHLGEPLRITELAYRFGLCERTLSRRFAAAFRRVFKEATGLSPGGYRDAYGLRNGPRN